MSQIADMEQKYADSARARQQIRNAVANIYDMQALRIAAGNRLISSFHKDLGVEPGESPASLENGDAEDKEKLKLLQQLKSEYKLITDAVAEMKISTKKSVAKNVADNPDAYIRDIADYNLVDAYMLLNLSEDKLTKVLEPFVKSHPMWSEFFEPIKGCGVLMSAVCIAYLDPYKAKHVSSFYRYCGLDTVQDTDKEGNKLFWTADGNKRKVRMKVIFVTTDGMNYIGKQPHETTEMDMDGNVLWVGEHGEQLIQQFVERNVNGEDLPVFEDIETGEEYVGDVTVAEHGRRKGDTEMFEYVDKDGKRAMKRGLTYNPVLKTKLMGVLTGCLLKAKDPTYSNIYYDYKRRLDENVRTKDLTAGHKNMMAQRYMIKQFLRNMWVTWRELEGLEVDEPYEVAKLGHKPHGLNEYQCMVARRARDFAAENN